MSDDPLDLDTGLPERIAADAAVLAPLTLSVARRLPASAGGVMRPDLVELARELHSAVAAVEGALEQLVASLALQHGVPVATLQHALTRNSDGSPSSPLGRLVDLFGSDAEDRQ